MIKDTNLDLFTLDIVKDSLLAAGEEMFYALARTSMSPIIYEVLDYASGLTDSKGQLLTQGNGVTGFIGLLTFMVKETLDKFNGGKDLEPGDIIIMNDPYNGGGSHLSDVGLLMPIFYKGELVSFSVNKAHWTEVGGKDPGSWTTDSTEIFQEGLQFPCIKLFNKGKINDALIDLIRANVRFPDLSLGDMWAQIAALRTGEKRFIELCDKYSKDTVLASIERLLDQSEKLTRKELQKLPKGIFEAEDYIDNDGLNDEPLKVKVKVTITDDKFTCDFRGSHPQVLGPVNCSYAALVSAIRTIFLAITNPEQDVNDGVFRPLEVITDKGSIFSCERPGAVSTYWESMVYGSDLVWKALAPELPYRLSAGHLLSVGAINYSGIHPDTKEPFIICEPSAGGWGAGEGKDGEAGQFCVADGETFNVPIEVAETRYGVLVDEYKFRADGAGAGKFRGGSGVIRSYRALSDNQSFTVTFGRNKFLPWGALGGEKGSKNEFDIIKASGEKDGPFAKCARYPLNTNDVVRLITASGGGYGNPLERDPEKVVMDVKNEFVTLDQAKNDYGVIIDKDKLAIKGFTDLRK